MLEALALRARLPLQVDAERAASRGLWLLNIALGAGIGQAYLADLSDDAPARLVVFAHLGLVSAVASFSLLPGAAVWALRRAGRRSTWRTASELALWTAFQLALLVDTRVWGLFHYHFGEAAWNLVTSKGAEDSFRLGPKVWSFAGGAAALIALGNALARALLAALCRRELGRRGLIRPGVIATALLLLIVGVEKAIYARADLEQDRGLVELSEALPLYPRLSVRAILPEKLRDEFAAPPSVRVTRPGAVFEHPDGPVELDPRAPRPNILVLVIDSWRRDMLDSEVTPHMARLASRARRFDDHLSTGNGTRFGVFGMLYGLHGSYWWPVLEARRAPVLLETLDAAGYEIRALSAASLDFPEFRATAWVKWPDAVWDDFEAESSAQRDQLVAARFEQWLAEREAARAFFAFVLLDSAHQPYDFPPEHALFTPFARDLDYVELAGSRDAQLAERVRNRYRNGLHHADEIAARILAALERAQLPRDTLVIVTGDHGEEFAENGYWGHTGNFTREQVATPLLVWGAGVEAGVETRPTSHVDLPGTLLELLGASREQVAQVCFSHSLFAPSSQRARVVAGWEELGLWSGGTVFRIPRDHDRGAPVMAFSAQWRPLPDSGLELERHAAHLERLSNECLRFLR